MKNGKKTVSIEVAADELGISRGFAYSLARQRKLPGLLVLGHHYLVSREVLSRVLAEGWTIQIQEGSAAGKKKEE